MVLTPAGYAIKGDNIAKGGCPIVEVMRANSLWLEVDWVAQLNLIINAPPKTVTRDALPVPMSCNLGPETVDIGKFKRIRGPRT